MSSKIATKVWGIAQPVVNEHGLEIVDITYGKVVSQKVLSVFLEKIDGNISIDECATINNLLSDILDAEDFIEDEYVLEVSSPGVNRVLKTDKDFERFTGSEVEVALFEAIDAKKKFVAVLKGFEDNTFIFDVDGKDIQAQKNKVSKINLYFDFSKELKNENK